MRRNITFIGIFVLAIGIVLIVSSLLEIPFQEQEEYFIQMSDALVEESFVVPVGEVRRTIVLNVDDVVNIDFVVTSGGNHDVDFIFGDGITNLVSLNRANSYNNTLTVPNDATYTAVWDNSFSTFTQKGVTVKISKVWMESQYRDITSYHTIIPSEYSTMTEYVGIAVLLAGIALIGFGVVSKEKTEIS